MQHDKTQESQEKIILFFEELEQNPNIFKKAILSNPVSSSSYNKIKIRPIYSANGLIFHAEQFTARQSFQRNFEINELCAFLKEMIGTFFKQANIETLSENITFLTNKKGKTTILRKKIKNANDSNNSFVDTQNRKKKYLLPEGDAVPFLIHLGVMTKDGKIVLQKYNKFKQINRFLEYIDDILQTPLFLQKKEISIIDFGCGKSYLTFAVYHYLTYIKKINARVVGLDLKEEVILMCNALAKEFGYKNLSFYVGDIAQYKADSSFDVMITLHACDTATDFALNQAINWGVNAILSVPCCQHELNGQLNAKNANPQFEPLLKYGIIKDRFAALATDVIRAELLEQNGYDVQILEFIDIAHTPKNLLIRAIKNESKTKNEKLNYVELKNALKINQTLETLLCK